MGGFTERLAGLSRVAGQGEATAIQAINNAFIWLRDNTTEVRGQLREGEVTPHQLSFALRQIPPSV